MRSGEVDIHPGYDGEYGVVRVFSDEEREQLLGQDVTDYFELDGMIDDFAPYYQLWHTAILVDLAKPFCPSPVWQTF